MAAFRGALEPPRGLGEVLRDSIAIAIQDRQIVLRRDESPVRRLAIPVQGLSDVPGDTQAVVVCPAQVHLSDEITLLGCTTVPHHALLKVLLDTITVSKRISIRGLSLGIATFRRLPIPVGRLLWVGIDAEAKRVQHPPATVGKKIALVGAPLQPHARLRMIGLHAQRILVNPSESRLGPSVPLPRALLVQGQGFRVASFEIQLLRAG